MAGQIRLASDHDAHGCLDIYASIVRDTPISFELSPPSVDEMACRIRDKVRRAPWLVCEIDDAVAGYAYAGQFRDRPAYRWSAETSVFVHPDHQGKGVGRGLYGSLLACLRVQGFRMVVGVITLPNPASVRLHEAVGFKHVGVFRHSGFKSGQWHDIGAWELDLGVPPGATSATEKPPIPPQELISVEAWRDGVHSGERYLK